MKLRKPAGNRSYLTSMLISFLAILLIPLAIFSFVLRNHFFHVLQEEISKNNLSSLERIVQQAEDDIEAMQQIVNQVAMTPDFYAVHDLSDYPHVWSCRQQLSTLLTSSQRFRNIVVSWEGVPAVLSNSGSCSLMLLKEEDPLRPQYDQTAGMRADRAVTNPINTADEHQLVFSWPVNFVRPAPRAELSFYLDASRYYGAFAAQRDVPVDYLVYHRGEKMASSQKGLTLPEEFIHTWQQQEGAIAITQAVNGKDMLICVQPTAGKELLFVSMMPVSYAMSIAGGLQRELMLCNVICVLLAFLVICISVRLNYRPLQRLLASVEHLVTTSAREDEITSIQQAVDTLKNNNEELRIISRQTTVNHLMDSLMGGVYTDRHLLPTDKLTALGFPMTASEYVVLIIKVMNPRSRRVTAAALTPIVNRYFPACLVKEDAEPVVLAAVNEPQLTVDLEALRQEVARQWDSPVALSASRPFTGLTECAEAYSEAVCSLDYRFIRGNDSLLLASEMNLQEEWMDHYPHQDLAMLRRMLNTRNLSTLEQIEEQLDSILEYIRACEVPMFAARMICFDVVNVVLSSMSDAERFHNRVHLTRLSHFETVDEMLVALSQLCHNLFALTEPDTDDVSRDLIQQMMLYVDCNFTDSNFSLQEMADYFHMSMANLSQYFKRKTGQTLISYYTNLRMEKARQLLSEGTMKLDEVAEKVGYLNTSSFVRRFKQFAGMSPTRWQEENQKGGAAI